MNKVATTKGAINLYMLIPLALMAVSSLKLDAFPTVNNAANNTDTGVISLIMSGEKTK